MTALDQDIVEALEVMGDVFGSAVHPLAAALQDARNGAAAVLQRYQATYDALAAVVDLLDRGNVRGNWATDQAILDEARDLVNRLSPPAPMEGPTDGDEPPHPA